MIITYAIMAIIAIILLIGYCVLVLRVEFDGENLRQAKGAPKFIELLEGVKLAAAALA